MRAPTARAWPTRNSRSRRLRTRDTSFSPDTGPGEPLRTRRLLGRRVGLPREPGRGLCQDLALKLHLAQLAAKLRQLLALCARQQITALAAVGVGSRDPVADRLRRGLELFCQRFRATSRLDQLDHLLPEFRRVCNATAGHRGPPLSHHWKVSTKAGQLQVKDWASLCEGKGLVPIPVG